MGGKTVGENWQKQVKVNGKQNSRTD